MGRQRDGRTVGRGLGALWRFQSLCVGGARNIAGPPEGNRTRQRVRNGVDGARGVCSPGIVRAIAPPH